MIPNCLGTNVNRILSPDIAHFLGVCRFCRKPWTDDEYLYNALLGCNECIDKRLTASLAAVPPENRNDPA